MAEIHPFHGVHYNQSLVKDLAEVLCPPFDVITLQMQEDLYQRNKYNFVRLEFGRELPQDKDTDNRYTRASTTLEKWLEQQALQIDKTPALYIHDHGFIYQNKQYCRRSITCLVKLEEWSTGVIRPHEGTLSSPKGDRLNLLWALQSDTSPVMALYDDRETHVSSILEEQSQSEPFISGNTSDNDSHQLWAITDTRAINQVYNLLKNQPLYIADGHHRYESALTYQRERRSTSLSPLSPVGQEPFDFVMMTLVDLADPGLLILPAHRLIRGLPLSVIDDLMSGLAEFFKIQEIPLNNVDTRRQISDLLSEEVGIVKLVLYGLKKGYLFLLRLNDFSRVGSMIPYFHSELYQRLDVSIIDHVICEELLGITHDKTSVYLDYSHDTLDAIDGVSENEYQLAIFLNVVKPEVIKAIADSGDRMPKKSTYFYPKIPTGLVFYKF